MSGFVATNKQKRLLQLIIIILIILLFSLFAGFQAKEISGFNTGFFITLGFGVFAFILQTEYFSYVMRRMIATGEAQASDFQNPLDIWMFSLPISVLMIISYLWLEWHIVQVYYCTTIALTGMLFGNGLGRGSNRWSIKKSLPFFFGVVISTAYALITGGVM